ncbi:MAG: hypothetical protein ACOX2K_08285 [Bacillota bacterium]|jgi:hypothetical protein
MMNAVIKQAASYVQTNGTPLQQACLRLALGKGSKDEVAQALSCYQNSDGGWANGLEVEYPGPVSTPFSTAVALGHIVRNELTESSLLQRSLDYLAANQLQNGSWDDLPQMLGYPHPPYMGPGIYLEFKTAMITKWLLRLPQPPQALLERAVGFLVERFAAVRNSNDFWTAAGYLNVFAQLPTHQATEILSWATTVLGGNPNQLVWPQLQAMIEDDLPVSSEALPTALQLIRQEQQDDGGWPHPFGSYNRVWAACFICRFLVRQAAPESRPASSRATD